VSELPTHTWSLIILPLMILPTRFPYRGGCELRSQNTPS
jgi:hypothetical protein